MYYSCHPRQDETWPFSVLLSFELTSIPHHALAAYQVKFRVTCSLVAVGLVIFPSFFLNLDLY
jgi:hypothetical protein